MIGIMAWFNHAYGKETMPRGITIVGLGPGHPKQLTAEAIEVLNQASELYLRTERHPTVSHLPAKLALRSFDYLYHEHTAFEEVYAAIADQVLSLGQRPEGVLYAVPGHPFVAESTVQAIARRAAEQGLPVRVVEGLSFVEPILTALQLDPMDGLQLFDAILVGMRYHPPLNPDQPAILAQLYNRAMAAQVKLTLMNLYPDDHPVSLVIAAGTAEQTIVEVPLFQLDRQNQINHLTSLFIPPLAQPGSLNTFLDIVAHLRAPDGCPWDREQTHQTLRVSLLEETYEVLNALDQDNMVELAEEMGDLLLQIVLHTQIAAEAGDFKMPDVAGGITAKMRRRHPHVFGDVSVEDAEEVLVNWDEIKAQERQDSVKTSLLDSIPTTLPALAQALAVQKRVARVGFDWPDIDGVMDKIAEEVAELVQANMDEREAELGDLLFSIVNLGRWLKLDPETALRDANARFGQRFRAMEAMATARGTTLTKLDAEALDDLWEQAKKTL